MWASPPATPGSIPVSTGDGGWVWQNPLPHGERLYGSFADADTGWAVGAHGTVLKTIDGGESWEPQQSSLGQDFGLSAVAAGDGETAWAVGDEGTVLRTLDGGQTWTSRGKGASAHLSAVQVVDAKTAWAGGLAVDGRGGTVIKTVNGGDSWANLFNGGITVVDISARDAQTAWVSDLLSLERTVDGGASWATVTPIPGALVDYVSAVDASLAWAVTFLPTGPGSRMTPAPGIGAVYKTADGGLTWTPQLKEDGRVYGKVAILDGRTAWVMHGAELLKTSDGGRSWVSQLSTTWGVANVAAVAPDTVYVFGSRGGLLRSSDGGLGWTGTGGVGEFELSEVATVSAQIAWAVGRTVYPEAFHAVVLRTTDGGTSWAAKREGLPGYSEISISVLDGLAAWVVDRYSGRVFRTEDGGASWRGVTQLRPTGYTGPRPLRGIKGFDRNKAWAFGHGSLWETNDGGLNWAERSTLPYGLVQVAAVNEQVIWAVTESGNILLTEDGGTSWTLRGKGARIADTGSVSITAVDGQTAWALADSPGDFAILKTENGGASWSGQLNRPKYPSQVLAVDRQTLWVVGQRGSIVKSVDGGVSWREERSGTANGLAGIGAVDGQTAWAVGEWGTILKTTTGGRSPAPPVAAAPPATTAAPTASAPEPATSDPAVTSNDGGNPTGTNTSGDDDLNDRER